MNPSADHARALLTKAADDAYVAGLLAQDSEGPAWVLGFHAEQAVEKALKAVLSSREVVYPRTHNLVTLLELLRTNALDPPPDGDSLARFIPFGVAMRYEDAVSEDDLDIDVEWALAAVSRTLAWARGLVG